MYDIIFLNFQEKSLDYHATLPHDPKLEILLMKLEAVIFKIL